jgi:hypothetical protein
MFSSPSPRLSSRRLNWRTPTRHLPKVARAPATKVDTLRIEPKASRMLSGCDTTTPRAHVSSATSLSTPLARLRYGDCGFSSRQHRCTFCVGQRFVFSEQKTYSHRARLSGINEHDTLSEWLRRWTRNPLGSARKGSNPLGVACLHVCGLHRRRRCVVVYDFSYRLPLCVCVCA